MLSDLALSLLRDGVTRGDMFFTVPQTPGTKAAIELYRSSLVEFDGMHDGGCELLYEWRVTRVGRWELMAHDISVSERTADGRSGMNEDAPQASARIGGQLGD